ncbi:MAG: hypothetical protein J6X91_05745 [Bacteroidales bacterium]|nr:hypothetical protein [Bacteroidales bacterium]
MKNFENLKAILESFENNRDEKKKDLDDLLVKKKNKEICEMHFREKYADVIGECFKPCAEKILAGHFEVTDIAGNKREIHPTVLELYYHEEDDGTNDIRFKDPIMYHTNDRKIYDFYKNEEYLKEHFVDSIKKRNKKDLIEQIKYYADRNNLISEIPYFPVGSLNPHTSGIDITFENPKEKYRAACLIREYYIKVGNTECHIKNSTDIYDDMLINGILLDNNVEWIEWKDGESNTIVLEEDKRKNVCAYEKYNDEPELWQKKIKEIDAKGKPVYEKCPFNWQFRIKNPQNNN